MRNYLVEVEGTLLQTLVNLMNDYSTNLLLYKDGYYQIDSSNHAKLPGREFTRLHSDLKGSRDALKNENEIEILNITKGKVLRFPTWCVIQEAEYLLWIIWRWKILCDESDSRYHFLRKR